MLVKIFKRQHNGNVILMLIGVLVIWVPSFFFESLPKFHVEPITNILYQICFNNVYILKVLGLIILLVSAVFLNNITNKYLLCSVKTELPGLLYILFFSAFTNSLYAHPILFCNLILLLIINHLFNIDKQKKTIAKMFDSGLLVGVSTMMYFESVYFILLILATTLVIGSVKWRDWVAVLLGFLVPYVFYFSYLYLTDNSATNFIYKIVNGLSIGNYFIDFYAYEYIYFIAICFLGVIAIYTYLIKITSMLSKVRKLSWVLVIATVLPLVYYLFSLDWNEYHWLLITIPISVFFSNVLIEFRKTIVSELVLYTIVGIIIYGHVSSYLNY